MTEQQKESFESFYKNYFYGVRNDLAFKFIALLNEQDASEFIKGLFSRVVDAIDSDQIDTLSEFILEWQIKAYSDPPKFQYQDMPIAKLKKPLDQSVIAIISSSGHFIKGQDPKPFGEENMTQEEAIQRISEFIKSKPELSEIPANVTDKDLVVRHGGYDIRAALQDINCVFPFRILNHLATAGVIRKVSDTAYSFVGACSQLRLLKESIPQWVERLMSDNVDGVVLTPV